MLAEIVAIVADRVVASWKDVLRLVAEKVEDDKKSGGGFFVDKEEIVMRIVVIVKDGYECLVFFLIKRGLFGQPFVELEPAKVLLVAGELSELCLQSVVSGDELTDSQLDFESVVAPSSNCSFVGGFGGEILCQGDAEPELRTTYHVLNPFLPLLGFGG